MTTDHATAADGTRLYLRLEGPPTGPALVLANSLGTDLHLWDAVLDNLPRGLRVLRYDMRGHGRSEVPPAPYAMGTLVSDAATVLDHAEITDSTFIGLSIGGMVAQGLAVKRPDLVRALVLSNTAAKIGTPTLWQRRIDAIRTGGLASIADDVMARWFSPSFRKGPDLAAWRARFLETPEEGYLGCCAAIAGTDFYTPTAALRLPTLGLAGSDDGATPADLVRETVDLIPGSRFQILRRTGHLPCVEAPNAYAQALTTFLTETGQLP
ncbi:3-oxoadipate enol-lactonase [Jannaschia pagri]|uniref:3-oxoadipate enol-lactonase n=1 Tax=Jannaschia pagri TaxID=2829797 RepID=A0ABQ4NK20_9RHOB|nr:MULTISPECIES: 3-oxoadipate enol-lactonase [unclassified Jannaschia]GIT90922.1 3-oxoadipate enol-lactonase [Jannaschia sp. AI_61]GIT94753.1 3-oxoadipate enol-lactonase [Jannaschia sp. AI_62]